MSDWIGNIFYFGSPKDGFKVYPDLGAVSNVFGGYYTNTETDWILIARKSENVTRYTYVRYDLLTSLVDGRTGSCFGISIDFLDHHFTDLHVMQTQIFEGIWGAILSEKRLLEAEESSGRIAFKSYDLHDVSQYLDELSHKIRDVIRHKKYSRFVKPSDDIPQAGENVHGLHPNSSSAAIGEYFRMYGAVKLSPKLPIETQSPSEKQAEHKRNLERQVEERTKQADSLTKQIDELTNQLKQRDIELQAANQKLERLRGYAQSIASEFPSAVHTYQADVHFRQSRSSGQTYEPVQSGNHGKRSSSDKVTRIAHSEGQLSPRARKILIAAGGGAFVLALVILLYVYTYPDSATPTNDNVPAAQPSSTKPAVTIASPEPLLFSRGARSALGVLNEDVFLQHANGKKINNEEDLKEVLTSFLFELSPEVRAVYRSKDELWNQILELNPESKKKIRNHLKTGPFEIESNTDQLEMLRGLVVFSKPL
jgi:hypothetical protein